MLFPAVQCQNVHTSVRNNDQYMLKPENDVICDLIQLG